MAKKATNQTAPVENVTEEKQVTVVQPAAAPALAADLGDLMQDDAGEGLGNITADDVALPFISILQSGSPQLKRGEQKIEGANEGDIFNTVTGEAYNGTEGVFVIPCAYKKAWVEWTPREVGGGFVKQHETADILNNTVKNDKGQDVLPTGNIIVTTAYHYILLVNAATGNFMRGVISMTSTQLKKSRKWNGLMTSLTLPKKDGGRFTPPSFSHVYHMVTIPEHNDSGNWSGWAIALHSQVPTIDLYTAAKQFSADISKGIIKEAIPTPDNLSEDAADAPY
jgi:hypothetical protein